MNLSCPRFEEAFPFLQVDILGMGNFEENQQRNNHRHRQDGGKRRRRAVAALQRYGYGFDEIFSVLNSEE